MDQQDDDPRHVAEVAAEVEADARRRHKFRRLFDRFVDERAPIGFVLLLRDIGRRLNHEAEVEKIVDDYLKYDLDWSSLERDPPGRHIRTLNDPEPSKGKTS